MRFFLGTLLVATVLAARAEAADIFAEEAPPPAPPPVAKVWQFNGALYMWATSVSGTAGFGDLPTVDVDASFSDILENLDMAFMGFGEARYGEYGLFGDVVYANISAGGDATGPLGGDWKADITQEMFIGTAGVEYRFLEQGKSSADLMVAARFYKVSLDTDVTFCSPFCQAFPSIPKLNDKRHFDEHWVDPMVGVKGRLQGDSPWYLTGWGMIGGFGAGSEFSWDAFGGIGYEINGRWSLVGGYRGLGVDYESNDLLFDVVLHGPIFGLVAHF